MTRLHRYDQRATRVCAVTPYSQKHVCTAVQGARWDSKWVSPVDPAQRGGAWSWPIASLPSLLRAFPDLTTDDPTLRLAIVRGASINVARARTRERAAHLVAAQPWQAPHASGLVLHAHQSAALLRTCSAGGSRALYHETGTGKTITAGEWLDAFVRAEPGMEVGVVVCPVTLVRAAWIPDLMRWFPQIPWVDLREQKKGQDREYAVRDMVQRRGRAVAIVNYEAVRTDQSVRRVLAGAAVAFDECSKIKDAKSQVTGAVRELAPTLRACLLLSGTPAPNSPMEYYPQMKVLASVAMHDPFPGTLTQFRDRYCTTSTLTRRDGSPVLDGKGRPVIKVKFDDAKLDEFHARMTPVCEWVKKSECIDLPEKVYVRVPIDLDPSTAARYAEMRDAMQVSIVNHYGEQLSQHAQNALAQLMRLRQITAGFVPMNAAAWVAGNEREQVMVPLGREKVDWLLEFVEDNPNDRVLVWTQFKFETNRVVEALMERGVAVDFVDGSVVDSERAGKIDAFKRGDTRVLIAHPMTMQYGVSLPGVSLSVFMSCSHSLEQYAQAQDRIHGIGRGDASRHSTFYSLVGRANGRATVDDEIQDCLDGKKELLTLVFDLDASRRAAAT